MQTLKDVFQREDERINIKNTIFCISLVVCLVVLAFGLRGIHFSLQQSPFTTATPTITADGEISQD